MANALLDAINSRDLRLIRATLAADPDLADIPFVLDEVVSPLSFAAEQDGSDQFLDQVFYLLLSLGADPNGTAVEPRSPLMTAIKYNQAEKVKALLQAGADVNQCMLTRLSTEFSVTDPGCVITALLYVALGAMVGRYDPAIMNLLLQARPNIGSIGFVRLYAVLEAVDRRLFGGEMVEPGEIEGLLQQLIPAADPDVREQFEQEATRTNFFFNLQVGEVFGALSRYKSQVEDELCRAIRAKDERALAGLLGASPELALISLTCNGQPEPLLLILHRLPLNLAEAVVRAAVSLLGGAANLDGIEGSTETPLARAIRRTNLDVAGLLVRYGADVNYCQQRPGVPCLNVALDAAVRSDVDEMRGAMATTWLVRTGELDPESAGFAAVVNRLRAGHYDWKGESERSKMEVLAQLEGYRRAREVRRRSAVASLRRGMTEALYRPGGPGAERARQSFEALQTTRALQRLNM